MKIFNFNKKKLFTLGILLAVSIITYIMKQNNTNLFQTKTEITDKKNVNMTNQTKNINIAFYNVENLFDIYNDPKTSDNDFTPNGDKYWTKERYNDKLDNIANVIETINPSVLGLAEIENFDVVNDLIHTKALKDKNYKIIHANNNDTRGIDVAAIYDSEVFNLIEYHYHRVNGNGNNNTRDILEITGQLLLNEPITFFITHWPSRRDGSKETEHKRIALAKKIRSLIDNIKEVNKHANIVVMGDFNDEPTDESILKYLLKDDLYNLHRKYEDTQNGTANHQGDWLVFDQIMVSKNMLNGSVYNIDKNNGEIFNSNEVTFTHKDGNKTPSRTYGGNKYYGGFSDHYAVYTTIKVINKKLP
jgi:predicted extracellular nuclease